MYLRSRDAEGCGLCCCCCWFGSSSCFQRYYRRERFDHYRYQAPMGALVAHQKMHGEGGQRAGNRIRTSLIPGVGVLLDHEGCGEGGRSEIRQS